MKVELTININLSPETNNILKGMLNFIAKEETSHHNISDLKRGKATAKKAEPEIEEDLEEPEAEQEEETEEAEEEAAPEISIDDVIMAAKAYSKKHGVQKAKDIIAKYKVKSIREVKAVDLPKLLTIFKKV